MMAQMAGEVTADADAPLLFCDAAELTKDDFLRQMEPASPAASPGDDELARVLRALEETAWNQTKAADLLGWPRWKQESGPPPRPCDRVVRAGHPRRGAPGAAEVVTTSFQCTVLHV